MTEQPEIVPIDLTDKQEAFCLAYVENGGNATQACYDAGYSPDSDNSLSVEGSRLLRNAKVLERIKQIRAHLGQTGLVSTEYIVQGLVEIKERCMESRMATDKEGNPLGYFTANHKEAINALKVLAGINGDLVKKVEMDVKGELPVKVVAVEGFTGFDEPNGDE